MSENVLLNLDSEPRFDAISAADIEPAMTEAMNTARTAIEALKKEATVNWDNT
ncbi:hypothetical protein SASC598O02_003920, partial [Snodgrassella alvi SCGC AB-598-O02]